MKLKSLICALVAFMPMQALAQAACNSGVDGYTFDWNNGYDWSGSGTTTNNFVVSRPGGGDPVTVSMNFTGATGYFSGVLGGFPQVSNLITGGYGTSQEALAYLVDFDNTSRVLTLNISFSEPVYNVTFPVLDIDYGAASGTFNPTGGFRDNVIIDGRNLSNSTVWFKPTSVTPYHSLPTTTQNPSTVELFSSDTGRGRGRTANALPEEDIGNMTASFAQPVTNIRIQYGNSGLTSNNPALQGIAIYDFNFCVPRPAVLEATKEVLIHRSDNVDCGIIPGTPEGGLPAAIPGSCVEYEINVENSGVGVANNVDVADILSNNLIYRGSAVSGFAADPGYAVLAPAVGSDCGVTTCNVGVNNGRLNSGATGTIIIRAEVK